MQKNFPIIIDATKKNGSKDKKINYRSLIPTDKYRKPLQFYLGVQTWMFITVPKQEPQQLLPSWVQNKEKMQNHRKQKRQQTIFW